MIGINFSYPDAADAFRHPPWTELRASRIEPGPPNTVWSRGETHEVQFYWRNWDIPLEERTRLMEDIVQGLIKAHKVDGFTLWWNWTKKQWQMNVRYAEERGWSVTYITQAEAEAVFSTLTTHHPDGPWKVKPEYIQDDAAAKVEFDKEKGILTPAARAEKQVDDLFDSTIGELPLGEALRRAEMAVERGNAVLASILGEGA